MNGTAKKSLLSRLRFSIEQYGFRLTIVRAVAALLGARERIRTCHRWESRLELPKKPNDGKRAASPSIQDLILRRDLPMLAHKAELSHQFSTLRRYWRDTADSGTVGGMIQSITSSPVFGKDVDARMYVLGAATLRDLGDFSGAKSCLDCLVSVGALDEVAYQLPAAAFAHEHGYSSPKIERAAAVWSLLNDGSLSARVWEFLRAKTVAVVGNGDLRGRGMGEEIDAHDVVVRFNNYPKGYEEDIGCRTDIWCRGSHSSVHDRVDIGQYKFVIWGHDFECDFLEMHEHLDILARYARWYPERIAMIPHAVRAALRTDMGAPVPSTGLQLVAWLHDLLGGLDGVDLYGFGAVDGAVRQAGGGHFYDSLGDYSDRHGAAGEAEFFASMLGNSIEQVVPEATVDTPKGGPTVFMCAYRPFDRASGRTGGPAGVQHTIQVLCNDRLGGAELHYLYEIDKAVLTKALATENKGLRAKVTDVILGAEAIQRSSEVRQRIDAHDTPLFICHDLGTAYGALLLGQPYVVVHHLQGSVLDEMESIGLDPTEYERHVASSLEKDVLLGAQRVYFPSAGAAQVYRQQCDPEVESKVHFASYPLYNTLVDDHEDDDSDRTDNSDGTDGESIDTVIESLGIRSRKVTPCDTFISISDYNLDKGLDRVPALLAEYSEFAGRKVEWIVAGGVANRVLYDELCQACSELGVEGHLLPRRIPHDQAMALLEYADYYLMMHRRSIFDLATLEAMRKAKPLILSPVGGNLDLDIESNVEFVDPDQPESWPELVRKVQERDREAWGLLNRRIYEEHFSPSAFVERYSRMVSEELMECGLADRSKT